VDEPCAFIVEVGIGDIGNYIVTEGTLGEVEQDKEAKGHDYEGNRGIHLSYLS
jgi:hypothetical protein